MTSSTIIEGAEEVRADIVERLRSACTDWDGTALPPASEPMDGLHCDVLIEAATEIATLRQQLAEANKDCTRANELINAAIDDYNAELELLAAAFDEWEGHNGRLTDPNDPHWSNDAIRLIAEKEV